MLAPILAALALRVAQESNPRYELAWRLRELERTWIAHPENELRVEALPHIEEAVASFFRFDVPATAEAVDTARAVLEGRGTELGERWPDGLRVTLSSRLLDDDTDHLVLRLGREYGELPTTQVILMLDEPLAGQLSVDRSFDGRALEWDCDVTPWPTGDHQAAFVVGQENSLFSPRSVHFSIVNKRDARLAELKAELAALPENAPALERATASDTLALLERLAKGATEETDYPAARLLSETERVVAAAAQGERWFTREHGGEFWLSIPNGRGAARVRLFVPDTLAADKPVPLVVALHGAGGSENMFFDAYGDGLAVKLCRERGWMLVAPRVTLGGAPVAAVIAALAERFPLDRARVFLVGHSMGAGAGQALIAKAPRDYRAFAALGGGSRIADPSALRETPIFVGAGERDFGRKGAESLHASLAAAGSKATKLSVYPSCEHLMVVVEALPDVFAWFDAHSK